MNTVEQRQFRNKAGFIKWMVIVALVATSALLLFSILAYQHKEPPIKIGAIIPLTGSASQHRVVVDALQLAIDEINSAGGLNDRQLQLIVADCETNPETAKKQFHQIEEEHHPLFYVSTTSKISFSLAALAEQSQAVLISLSTVNPMLTVHKKWVFKYHASLEQEAVPIMAVLNKLEIDRLAVLYQDDPSGTSHHTKIKREFEKGGGRILSVPFTAKQPDFQTKTAGLENSDAVYIAGFVDLVGQALRQLRQDGYLGVILAHSGATSLPHSMPELEDVYVAAPIIYDASYVFAREAKERYEARYNQFFTHQAANGYDLLKIIAGLLEDRELSREQVMSALEDEFSYPGVLGFIDKKQGAHDMHFPLYPARFSKGRIHYLPLEIQ